MRDATAKERPSVLVGTRPVQTTKLDPGQTTDIIHRESILAVQVPRSACTRQVLDAGGSHDRGHHALRRVPAELIRKACVLA